jgi:large subunit ribosomal protein L19
MAKKADTASKPVKLPPVNKEDRKNLDLRPGDTVKVFQIIQEKGKTRLQAFEGIVLARKHHTEDGGTFTVRKVSEGVGVERIFPLYSPSIDKIEIIRRAKVRRAKLYYIRTKAAKEVNRQMKAGKALVGVSTSNEKSEEPEVATEITQ